MSTESDTYIIVTVPVSFTRKDWERKDWSAVREQLLLNATEAIRDVMAQEIRRKGWTRGIIEPTVTPTNP